jgi:hypothetical protein
MLNQSSEPANSDSSNVLGSINETESCTEDHLRKTLQALMIEQNRQWIDRAIDLNEKLQSEVSFQLETINNKLMDILKRMVTKYIWIYCFICLHVFFM